MTMEVIMEYFARYGGIGIFVIVKSCKERVRP